MKQKGNRSPGSVAKEAIGMGTICYLETPPEIEGLEYVPAPKDDPCRNGYLGPKKGYRLMYEGRYPARGVGEEWLEIYHVVKGECRGCTRFAVIFYKDGKSAKIEVWN